MNYDVKAEIEKDCLVVVVSGKRMLEDNVNLIPVILEISNEKKVDKVVIDIRGIKGQLEIASEFTLAKTVAAKVKERAKKVAIICVQEDFIYFSFFEKVARHQGLRLSVFQSKSKALDWISKE